MQLVNMDAIFRRFLEMEPHPVTELTFTNDYTLLVAIVLSAQATDVGVNKATPALFKAADTPKKMLALGEEGLKKHIKTIGLFNSKAKNIIGLSKILVEDYGGKVPTTREELITLPGVGRKTANVWLNCARGEPTIAVDTHVFRVANRLGLCKTKTPEKTEEALENAIPKKWKLHAHHWLILHGRYVCKARKPECYRCVVAKWCAFPDKTRAPK
ncbi:MAG: endonuclease III [Alphaproteobacteria bacterium]|nr:endonuclease III [Alphaproteobacteria bacterium]